MAIININANLNGGDDTTPDNELFYRIYGDVDAYASPIHTTGTAIADADVTVTGDVVDISNVDGTTNTSFKIAAVDGAGNEGILSDAVSGSIALFEDDFAGTTINTTTKWDLVNDEPALVSITQNDELIIDFPTTTTSVSWGDYLRTQFTLDATTDWCCSFDLVHNDANLFWAGMNDSMTNNDTFLRITNDVIVGGVTIQCRDGGVDVFSPVAYTVDVSTVKTFKLLYIGGNVIAQIWNGASWDIIAPSTPHTWTANPMFGYIAGKSNATASGTKIIDNFYITDENFQTQYPT